jgi:2'-5' RNA ligase
LTQGSRSAPIVEVPEAEPAVARHRIRLDGSAPLGVPAHVTVLSRFRCRFDHTGWFGQDVLWLGPREPGPFRALTGRVHQAFPAFPPYQGQFEDVIPHLTIGEGHPLNDLRAAEESVRARRWTRTASFTLA